MGVRDWFRGASNAPSIPGGPIGSSPAPARSEYMRGGRAGIFESWLPYLRDSREDVRQAYWLSAARTIEMMHNSGWLAGLVRQSKANIMGDGLELVPQPDYKTLGWTYEYATEWARDWRSFFNVWASNPLECDAAGKANLHLQAGAGLSSYLGAGEIVALIRWIRRSVSTMATKIQLVPAHRLTQESNGIDLYQGVRIDPNGLPLSYRMRLASPLLESGLVSEIPARDRLGRAIVAHIFDGEIGQMRGLSPFAPALYALRQHERLNDSTLSSELQRAIVAGTIVSELPTSEVMRAFQDPDEQGVGSPSMDGLMGARADFYDATKFDLNGAVRIVHLFPGEKLDLQTGANGATTYLPLSENLLREVAVCAGHTVEEVTGNYSGASYTSVRIATTTRWPITTYRRRHLCAPFYQVAHDSLLEEAIDTGRIRFPGGIQAFYANRAAACRAKWRGPPKPQADDLKFAKSCETMKRLGIVSDERLCGENGDDWEDVYEQRAEEMAARKRLKLPDAIFSGGTIINEDDLEDDADAGKPGEKPGQEPAKDGD